MGVFVRRGVEEKRVYVKKVLRSRSVRYSFSMKLGVVRGGRIRGVICRAGFIGWERSFVWFWEVLMSVIGCVCLTV